MRSFFRSFSIILLVLWMGFIFYMSAQPAEVSSEISGSVIEIIAEKVYPNFAELSSVEKTEVVASFQFVARKSAHIIAFAVLGVLSFLSFVSYRRLRFSVRMLLSALLCLLYAASDEYHQRFVSGRSCELRDFLLDAAGIIGAILICLLLVKIIPPLRRKTAFLKKTVPPNAELSEHEQLLKPVGEAVDTTRDEVALLECAILEKEKTIEHLTSSLAEKTEEIIKLNAQNKEFDMNSHKGIELSSEMQYAAAVIGKSVIEVTKVCNKILTNDKSENSKELVNLALGRNEVLKANILKILDEPIEFSKKQKLIEKEKCEAVDYFNSIIAQMC
ncbi:MAG: VanZ family protein [Clostridia bacterium]|nr:VanZ family protein [Clostridia bacterium]